jgi:hypothetical protein
MNEQPTPESVRLRMDQLRNEMGHNVEETVENARVMLDWRHYVKTYPWICVAAAATAGFLLVPKREKLFHPDASDLAELAKRHRLVVEPQSSAKGGVAAGLVAMAATAASRAAITHLTQYAERALGLRTAKDKP